MSNGYDSITAWFDITLTLCPTENSKINYNLNAAVFQEVNLDVIDTFRGFFPDYFRRRSNCFLLFIHRVRAAHSWFSEVHPSVFFSFLFRCRLAVDGIGAGAIISVLSSDTEGLYKR